MAKPRLSAVSAPSMRSYSVLAAAMQCFARRSASGANPAAARQKRTTAAESSVSEAKAVHRAGVADNADT